MLDKLQENLVILQKNTIGLFKNPYGSSELVIEENLNDKGNVSIITTISIGSLGGLNTTYVDPNIGIYKRFPEDKSLSQMMDDPFGLNTFINSFK